MHGMQKSSGFSFSAFYTPFHRESCEDHEYQVPGFQNPFIAELSSKYSKGVESPKNSGLWKNGPNFFAFRFQDLGVSSLDSESKTEAGEVTLEALEQKTDFGASPKPACVRDVRQTLQT